MHFWRIAELKTKLKVRPLTDREALPYLLAYMVLTAAATMFPAETMNTWDYVIAVAVLLLTVAGTVYTYRCNGGANGTHFLQRYFAICWVIAVRWAAVVIPLFVMFMFIVGAPEYTTWYTAAYFTVAGAI